ncbi:hypothetical protein BOCO_0977 [Bombiscardovia coagulans]|uniref:Uncharacterized protein n=1 Tax=Bombiscardovia coagulans TaxID=686666 RepID=A0A261EQN5_9BIFI|nr:hypothetical protein BOCO_0977 [Bombiscardovia coagulans]
MWITVDILISYPLCITRILDIHKKGEISTNLFTAYPRIFSSYSQGLPTYVNKSVDNFYYKYYILGRVI